MTAAPGRATTAGSFVLVTGSTLLGGVLNAAVIALATRRGEIAEIAAYTVMMAVLAVVGVTVGGGSALLYLSGGEDERRAARSQRLLLVTPALLLAALAVIGWYAGRGYSVVALAATALVFVANNLAELPLAQLHRDLRFPRIALPTVLGKVASLAMFVPGATMTAALLTGAVVNLVAFELLAGARSPLRDAWFDRPTIAAAWQGFRSGRGLYVYTLAELFATRVPSIGLSLVVPLPVMGSFGAVTATFQAGMSVFQSGLNMVLSLRGRARTAAGTWRLDAEIMSLGAGLIGAVAIVVAAPVVTGSLLALDEPGAAAWLRVLGVALPLVLVNRIVATHAIADGRPGRAAAIALGLAGLTTGALAVAVPLAGALGGPLATLAAEATVALALAARSARTRGRRRHRVAGPPVAPSRKSK